MADIFDAYALADAWDEMFERPGEVRTAYEPVLAALQPIEPGELRFKADQMARAFTDRGVTYASRARNGRGRWTWCRGSSTRWSGTSSNAGSPSGSGHWRRIWRTPTGPAASSRTGSCPGD